MPGFWIYQGTEYTSSSDYTRVLNVPGLQHGDIPWLHRVWNMPEWKFLSNFWICLNMLEYACICLNLPELHCFAFSHSNSLFIWTRGYLFQSLHELEDILWRNMRLFFEETKYDFFIETGSISSVFCYRLNSFISEISNLMLLWQGSEAPLRCITF